MMKPSIPANERERLRVLHNYGLFDSHPDHMLDSITGLVAHLLHTPMAGISVVDAERQWFKSRHGFTVSEVPREVSLCAHVVASSAPLVVPDCRSDERFCDNPLVLTAPSIVFYAGFPLCTSEGAVIGALCAMDYQPRQLSAHEHKSLEVLANQAVELLELQRKHTLNQVGLSQLAETANVPMHTISPNGTILWANRAELELLGYTRNEYIDQPLAKFCVEDHAVENILNSLKNSETVRELPMKLRAKDGSTRIFLFSASPYSDSSSFRHGRCVMRDVTELEANRLELKTYQKFFTLSLDLLCTADSRLVFQELNPAWEQTLGWSREELRSRPATEFVHPADLEPTMQAATRLLWDDGTVVNFETRFQHKEGRWVTLSWVATAYKGTIFASARDITSYVTTISSQAGSDIRLRAIIDTAVDAIITIDEMGQIERVNPAVERLFGYAPSELIGENVRKIMPMPDRERHDEYLGSYRRTGKRKIIGIGREVFGQRKDGSTFSAELSVSEMIVGGRRMFTGIIRDISERRLASEALARKNEDLKSQTTRLDAVINTVVDGIITIDSKGTIHTVNPAAERIFGFTAHEIIGKNIDTLTSEPFRANNVSYVRRYLDTGEQKFVGIGREAEGIRKDGSRFPLELAISEMNIAGEQMFTGIIRDITERKQVERDLSQFVTTLDRTQDSILIFEPKTLRFLYANQGAVNHVGYALDELLRMTPLDLVPQFDETRYRRMLEPLVTGEVPVVTFETLHRHKDGHDIPMEVVLQYMAPAGENPRFTNIARDISERKRIDKMKSEFVSTVSHELRTPLTSIRGSLGLVSSGITGELPKQAQEYVEIALSNSDRLVRLINDILDIEKIQSGGMELRMQTVKLSTAINKAIVANESFAAAHKVSLALVGELPRVEVLVDEDRFMQVLTNLISNAAKFSPHGQAVELSAELTGTRVRINVRDYGSGIAEEFRNRIFQRFAQADSSDTRRKGGTGLGLSISKALVEEMRGEIGFQTPDGPGTLFYIDLPWLPQVEDEARGKDDYIMRALVCEDDLDVAHFIRKLLEQEGLGVHVAPTVERARELLTIFRYCVVTLDLKLADGDGLTLMPDIQRAEQPPGIPVIIISGTMGVDVHANLGPPQVMVADVLPKPVDEARLRVSIRAACMRDRSKTHRILHVEEDADLRRIVKRLLPEEWSVVGAETIAEAKALLSNSYFDVVLLDRWLPDGRGDTLLDLVGPAQVIIFSASEVSQTLARRVSMALVKSRTSEFQLRDAVMTLMSRGVSSGASA